VGASAGKNASLASSASVMWTAVPNVEIVDFASVMSTAVPNVEIVEFATLADDGRLPEMTGFLERQ
jgi:hypothetical protein